MPHSMTAFARQTLEKDWGTASWEIRSVNHRFLEMSFRLPETARDIEMALRNQARQMLNRGKLDISLQLNLAKTSAKVEIDLELTRQYIEAARQVESLLPQSAPLSALEILQWPGILQEAEVDMGAIKQELLTLFAATLRELVQGRAREGDKLKAIITAKLDAIGEEVQSVRQRMPQLIEAQRNKIVKKLQDVTESLDNDRLEQELTYIAQRADVEEEMDRLDTHISEFRRTLDQPEPIGRRLDFLLQELNREANTLASKSLAAETTQSAVELKVLIEQIREQIQNIE